MSNVTARKHLYNGKSKVELQNNFSVWYFPITSLSLYYRHLVGIWIWIQKNPHFWLGKYCGNFCIRWFSNTLKVFSIFFLVSSCTTGILFYEVLLLAFTQFHGKLNRYIRKIKTGYQCTMSKICSILWYFSYKHCYLNNSRYVGIIFHRFFLLFQRIWIHQQVICII